MLDTRTEEERALSIARLAQTHRVFRDTGVRQGPLFTHLDIDPEAWLKSQDKPFEEVEAEYNFRVAFRNEVAHQDLHPEDVPAPPTFREVVTMFAPELLDEPGIDEFIGD
jgi:hypothetical protein